MNKSRHLTAFYVETLLLTVTLILVAMVLTRMFGLGSLESSSAKTLTAAVGLAENAAEAMSASESPEDLLSILDENNNAVCEDTTVTAYYDADFAPASKDDHSFAVSVLWEPDPSASGLVNGTILVTDDARGNEIYRLTTAVYIKEGAK